MNRAAQTTNFCLGGGVRTDVALLTRENREDLCGMLRSCDDFPQELLYLYERDLGTGRDETFVAYRAGEVVGMLSGTFDSDFHESGAFEPFDPPPAPHAFLDRVHIAPRYRRLGIGRRLIKFYADEAAALGCTFIGGSLDLSSDPTERRAFFEQLGFTVREHDNFGAPPSHVR